MGNNYMGNRIFQRLKVLLQKLTTKIKVVTPKWRDYNLKDKPTSHAATDAYGAEQHFSEFPAKNVYPESNHKGDARQTQVEGYSARQLIYSSKCQGQERQRLRNCFR